MSHRIAIDFGTTNSVLAEWDEKAAQARLLAVPGLSQPAADGRPPLIPSLLYVEDGQSGQIVLGQAVVDNGYNRRRDNRLFRNFKRGMLVAAGKEPRLIDGAPWSDYDAALNFLKGLLLAQPYSADQIEQLVLTVPVAAFDDYLNWMSARAGDLLAESVQLVDESTAAALGYYVNEPGALVLVFDFGGGSLDLSLVQLPESRVGVGKLIKHLRAQSAGYHPARVIAKAGLNLGGSDIDQWLLLEVLRRLGLSFAELGADYAPLLTACETAKIALSNQAEYRLECQAGGEDFALTLSRGDLEGLLESNGFFAAIRRVVEKVMHLAHRQGIFKEDLQHVLLTGGTSLIPAVQAALREAFRPEAVRVEKPFTAVVEGALQIAAGLGLQDHLVHSYGLRYVDPHSGQQRYDEIIPTGCPYPTTHPVEVALAASRAHQPAVEFVIGQIELDAVANVEVRYEDGQAVFVAQAAAGAQQILPLNDQNRVQVRLDPPGRPGERRLLARFGVDAQRQLRLSVVDLRNGKEVLKDSILATLGVSDEGTIYQEHPLEDSGGLEPALAETARPVEQRLSLRRLGTLLNMLPPESISLQAAVEALKSDEFYVRYQAAELLSRRGDRDARLIFEDFLRSGTPPQRAVVARCLDRFSWYTAEPLLRQALADGDFRVREAAVYALCRARTVQAYQILQDFLPGEGDALKSAAAFGLSRMPDPASQAVLEIILTAGDPEVRVQALELMAETESPAAVPAVVRSMDDGDVDVVYAATLSWIELSGPECFTALAQRINEKEGDERRALVRGLFHATNYLVIRIEDTPYAALILQALQNALLDEQPATRLQAFMPLAWMHTAQAGELCRQALQRETDEETLAEMRHAAASLA
jgi:molecular chaperone DnaK (HSP70)